MNYYLGIDGGGSKTEAVIIDDNERVLGIGLSAGSNTTFTARQVGVASFTAAIAQALEESRLSPSDITAAAGTFSNVAPDAFEALGIGVEPRGVSEALVAFERAGVRDLVGVALIAGTGSSCTGRNSRNEAAHGGGWGAVLGDDGSAFYIGRCATRRVMFACEDRMPPTLLTHKALEYFQIANPRELIGKFGGSCVNQTLVAGFAAKVSEAAGEGDEAAVQILNDAGRELAELSLHVASEIFEAGDDFPVVLAGGVFKAGEIIVGRIRETFAQKFPNSRILVAEMRPGEAVARLVRRAYQEERSVDSGLLWRDIVRHRENRRKRG